MKNKISKHNQNQIKNIQEMLKANEANLSKDPVMWAQFQKSWMEIIQELEAGAVL